MRTALIDPNWQGASLFAGSAGFLLEGYLFAGWRVLPELFLRSALKQNPLRAVLWQQGRLALRRWLTPTSVIGNRWSGCTAATFSYPPGALTLIERTLIWCFRAIGALTGKVLDVFEGAMPPLMVRRARSPNSTYPPAESAPDSNHKTTWVSASACRTPCRCRRRTDARQPCPLCPHRT
jgi:hypothetical protein